MSDAAITMYPVEIAKAIIAVKKQVKQLGVDDNNKHGGYPFVSVDKFYERIGKLMADAGLALLIDETGSEIKAGGKEGNAWLFAHYELRFLQESGAVSEPLRRSLAMPISGPQAYGAAQSYIEKQFLRQVFKIPTGEKDADDTAQDDTPPARQAPRAGMVRAADVPPQKSASMMTGAEIAAHRNGNGNGKPLTPAELFRNDMLSHFARAKTPAYIDGLITKAKADLEAVHKDAPEVYAEIMTAATNAKNTMYGETG